LSFVIILYICWDEVRDIAIKLHLTHFNEEFGQ